MSQTVVMPMHRIVLVGLAALLGIAACDKPAPADFVEIVGASAPCTSCRIEIGPTVQLHGGSGDSLGLPTTVSVDGRERYWLARHTDLPSLYDSSGAFLQYVGTRGSGTNEFQQPIAFLPLPGDSMLVFDVGTSARAVVIGPSLEPVRTIQLPGLLLPGSAVGWPNHFLLSGIAETAGARGWTLHTVSAEQPELAVLNSFGNESLPPRRYKSMAAFQRVTPARDSGYWTTDILQYRISHFSDSGSLIRMFDHTPDWFPSPSPDNIGTPTSPPPPKIFAIWQAPDGLLWVYGRVASRDWHSGWPKVPPGTRDVPVSAIQEAKLYSTMVEVLDPQTGLVVTSKGFDGYASAVLTDGRVVFYAEDLAGQARITVSSLLLIR